MVLGREVGLPTIAFRLREIHHLLAIRVEQENQRLEAEALEPVTESRFLANVDSQETEEVTALPITSEPSAIS